MSFGQGGPGWGPGGQDPRQPPQGNQGGQWGQNPQQQPQWGPNSQTPDWSALAEESAGRARRRKWLMIGGGALATVAIGTVVAIAVVSANGDSTAGKPGDLPATADIPPTRSSGPAPSFSNTTPPPLPDPKDFISSADKDKAPLSAGTLFPGDTLTMSGRGYDKGPTASTDSCASVTHGALGSALTGNGCTRVIRATYTAKGGVAVTVGVAVFDNDKQAAKAAQQGKKGNVSSLSGHGVSSFCTTAICRSTANSYGRYAYFTIGGFSSGKDVTQKDSEVFSAGDDVAEYAFRQIIHRGEMQASAAANAPR